MREEPASTGQIRKDLKPKQVQAQAPEPRVVTSMGRVAGKRECGVCGQVRRIEIRARDGRPDICTSCAPTPSGDLRGVRADGEDRAQSDRRLAGGRDLLLRLPLAVCTDCRRTKPCYHAHAPEPVCPSCTALRRAPVCLDCGERRVARRRVDGGVICDSCDRKRGGTTAACHGCGTTAPLIKRLCAACRLRERVAELAAGADPTRAAALAPFLRELAEAEKPLSTLRWFYTPGFEITRRLLAGEIPVSHQGLDDAAVDAPNPVAFVRAALVDSGVLEPRDEYSAKFCVWHARAVLQISPGRDRAQVAAYATWHVAHQLARIVQRRGEVSYASLKHARSLVTEAIKLVNLAPRAAARAR